VYDGHAAVNLMAEKMPTEISPEDANNRRRVNLNPRERSQLIAEALSDAARRMRFSTRGRRALSSGGFRGRPGQRAQQIFYLVSFVVMVAIPNIGAAIYYGLIAADQYAVEARFTVRGGAAPKLDSLAALTGVPTMQIIQDTQIVVNFVESRAIVEQLDQKFDLRRMFSRFSIDPFSRFNPEKPIEKLVRYWKTMVEASVLMPSGIVVLTVRAFTPEDATKIANGILDASEKLINQMNDRMRHDAVALSELEQQRAGERLTQARIALEKARNDEGMLSAEGTADAVNNLISTARSDLLRMQQEYETQKRNVSVNAPQMRYLQTRISATNEQIALLQAKLTNPTEKGDVKAISNVMSKLNYLELDRQISEKLYSSTVTALERARLSSESKTLYINSFVLPVLPQEAKYPRRFLIICGVAIASLLSWGLLCGLTTLVRNNIAR
jgi:capsular polysaccharide transport system permease protein